MSHHESQPDDASKTRMKLPNDLFQTALKSVSIINTRKANPEGMVNLMKLEASKGVFRMTASEGGQYAVAEIECEGDLKPICVPAHSLANIAPLFDGNVSMDVKGAKLEIRSKGSFSLPTIPADQFTALPADTFTKIGVNCADLAECIDRVRFAARKTDDRPVLHAVVVRIGAKALVAQASTGHVMAVIEKSAIAAQAEFLVPLPFIGNVINALKADGAALSVSPSRILVEHSAGCYSCVLTKGKFMDISKQIEGKHVKIGEFKPKDWLPVFRTVLAICGDKIHPVVSIKEGRVKFEESADTIDRSIDKLSKSLKLNASTFLPCLEAFGDDSVCASVYDDQGALRMDCGGLMVLSVQLR